jgi:pimeloyl-ACP methyl ester carboxylesterase
MACIADTPLYVILAARADRHNDGAVRHCHDACRLRTAGNRRETGAVVLLHVIERGPDVPVDAPGGTPGARPPSTPVVFLHGLFGRARNLGFLQRQAARTRRTLALDLRGHGDSPHGPIDYPGLAADVIETLAHHNALPATIIGHSMGGKTAMIVALTHPEAVSGLLIADMAPARTGHGQSDFARAMLGLRFPPSMDRAQAAALLEPLVPGRAVRDLMLQNVRLGDEPGWSIAMPQIVDALINIENWPYIPEGHVYPGPTLFVSGGQSPYVRPEHRPVMRQLFPNSRAMRIEEAGHWLHVEEPRKFSAIMNAFLAEN